MSRLEERVRYVVVCFSLYRDRAIYYRKCQSTEEILDSVRKCVEKGAHVMSIRMYIERKEGDDYE
jgi:hypothetical protein